MNVLLCLLLATFGLQADGAADATSPPAAATAQAEAPAADAATPATTTTTDPPESPPAPEASTGAAAAPTATSTPAETPETKEAAPASTPAGTTTDASIPAINPGTPGQDQKNAATTSDASPGVVLEPSVVAVKEVSSFGAFLILLQIVILLVAPFVIARLVCSALQMREYTMRMGLVLFALTIGVAPFINAMSKEGGTWKDALRFGIDLAGGTNMVFEVDRSAAQAGGVKQVTGEMMDRMVAAVGRRINPGGTEEITVRRVGSDRIEVIVPKATTERVESIKRRIVDLGSLEFDIMANIFDHSDIIAMADKIRANPDVTELYDDAGDLIAKWRPVATDTKTNLPKPINEDRNHARPRVITRNGRQITEFLLIVDPDPAQRVTGEYLTRASQGMSEQGLAVNFQFSQRGGYLFQQLTNRYKPRPGSHNSRLAILLNEEIHSAPEINAVIGSSGQITGQFDQQEIDELVAVLNAGALEVPLNRAPVNEYTVSPLLGADVQTKGFRAMVLAGLSVFVVMLAYYWKLGVVANLCMAANVVLLMGIMSLIDATLTLPGLAGIVLTIGMSVDANVLIYERFREEKAKGSSLRMTIHNGFHKALSTIIDSNLTTLITAVVLYVVGTEQIRGFAVSLFIGIVVSMFTALFMGRLIFDIAERKRWIKDVKMMEAIGETHYVFSARNKMFAAFSLTFILAGLATFIYRGQNNLDIDFRGGSMATIRFEGDTPPLEELQKRLDGAFEETVAIEQLQTADANPHDLIRIRSTKANDEDVSRLVASAFADSSYKLVRQEVTPGEIKALEDSVKTDFAGGHEIVLTLKEPSTPSNVSDVVAEELGKLTGDDGKAQKYAEPENLLESSIPDGKASGTSVTVRAKPLVSSEDFKAAIASYETLVESRPLFDELNTFDQAVALDTQWIAITAIVISLAATIAYLWFRFQAVDFGFAAVVGVLHDIFVVLGISTFASMISYTAFGQAIGLQDFKLNLSMIASYLTIVGYSLNDTIVVFDRIRELRGKSPTVNKQLVDNALNQTLSRTLLTGVTTLIVIFIMYAIGGEGLRGFSFALFMGIVVGTYSSVFLASPTLVWLMQGKQLPKARGAAAA